MKKPTFITLFLIALMSFGFADQIGTPRDGTPSNSADEPSSEIPNNTDPNPPASNDPNNPTDPNSAEFWLQLLLRSIRP